MVQTGIPQIFRISIIFVSLLLSACGGTDNDTSGGALPPSESTENSTWGEMEWGKGTWGK